MIEVGDIVRTSYGTGPYRVVDVMRDCTCPAPLDVMNMRKPPASPPHFHLTLVKGDCPIGKEPRRGETMAGYYWLNGYAEKNGRYLSVWQGDELTVERKGAGVQLCLFDL